MGINLVMSKINFRDYLPNALRDPKIDARTHTQTRMRGERPQGLFKTWRGLFSNPFLGLTTDGQLKRDLFSMKPEGAPNSNAIRAVEELLAVLTPNQKAEMHFEIASENWRNWQNTELFVETHGLRLDEQPVELRKSVMAIVRASMSARGFEMSRDVMRLNGFLGELIGTPLVLGEWTYIFCLFGHPSMDQPWGWQLFGHHLCLNCFFLGDQMVLTPAFMGAEPSYGDEGKFLGLKLFEDEEREGLALMRSLSEEQQITATVAHSMMGGDLPKDRRHFADNLHLGGAFQDNRIVPYEGLAADMLTRLQQRRLLDLIEAYLITLPAGPRTARMTAIEKHIRDTHFCWIGGTEEHSPFYYRIQSPVTFIEFDHHTGVFLTNKEPAKFHVHTIVRTPNGNDYGIDLLKLHYKSASHHKNHR